MRRTGPSEFAARDEAIARRRRRRREVSDFPRRSRCWTAHQKLPADVPVVLVVPPLFYNAYARAGTLRPPKQEACNTALGELVAGRPRSNFINYRIDNALTRDRANFTDYVTIGRASRAGWSRESPKASARRYAKSSFRFPLVPAKARSQGQELDARFCGQQQTLGRRLRHQITPSSFQPQLARKAALDLAAGGLRQRAGPDQHDVPREDFVSSVTSSRIRPVISASDRSCCARCARLPAR